MLNGRVGQNDYTGLSNRGRTVIDYCCVPYEQLSLYTDFAVTSSMAIVDKHGLELPREVSKLPDHAAIIMVPGRHQSADQWGQAQPTAE